MIVTIAELKSLLIELDYQVEFDYDKRIDFFNKWGISTATKYFNPITSLVSLIEELYINNKKEFNKYDLQHYGVSHSGAVMSAFNKEIKENTSSNIHIKIDSPHMFVLDIFKYNRYETETQKKMIFRIKDNTFSFKLINVDIWVSGTIDHMHIIENFITDFKRW